MKAIFKREFLALFRNVIGWLFIGVTLAFYGLYLTMYNLLSGYPNVSYPLSGITFIFVITVPILTMRILAEERKNKTDQLILTSPVSVGKIVFAKYLALAAAYSIAVGVMCLTPWVLHFFGTVDYLQNYTAVLGFWLYGLTCIAIGLFVSSWTESQVVSAILTVVILFIGYMMNSILSAFSVNTVLSDILGAYDLITPLQTFLQGTLSLVGAVYYVSVIALVLFLSTQVIQKRRWTISANSLSVSAYSVVSIVLAFAIVICANVVMNKLPEKYTQIDATSMKLYTMSDEAKDYLKTFDKADSDVTIYVIGKKSEVDSTIQKTLTNFEEADDHITVTYVDTDSNPTFVSQYTSDSLSSGSLIVVSDKRSKVVSYDSIYFTEINYETYSSEVTGYDGEGQIVSALNYVISDSMPVVYELTGHDEVALSGNFSEALSKANVDVQELTFLSEDAVPEDAAAVIISAPQGDFSADDIEKLKAYADGGGNILVTFDFLSTDLPNLKAFLSDYGVSVADGVVADLDADYYYRNSFYLLPNVESADETSGLTGTQQLFSPYSVGLTYTQVGNNSYTPLLTTSDSAVSKISYTDQTKMTEALQSGSEITAEDGDISGPFSVGLRVDTASGGKLYIFGSAYLFLDDSDSIVSGRNSTFFGNVLTAMMPEDSSSNSAVIIPEKDYGNSQLTTTTAVIRGYGILFSILIPLLSIIVGIVIWAVRRRK